MHESEIVARWKQASQGRELVFEKATQQLADLLGLMADLRGPNGCPWDREQSLASLRQYVREEADEVCSAIDRILELEVGLRAAAGLPPANPQSPSVEDRARTTKKGQSIAHHPHQPDFRPEASASGAPLPLLNTDEQLELDAAYQALTGELGDLLLQNVFMGDILHAMGRPGVEGAAASIIAKLIRRHPHVYGEAVAADSAAVLTNWELIKQAERAGEP